MTLMRTGVLTAIVLAVLVAGHAAGAAEQACTPGVRKVNGSLARVFCGPATVTVVVAGKRVFFRNGECERTAAYFTINVGIVGLDPNAKRRPDYFGITVGRTPFTTKSKPAGKDGAYVDPLIAFTTRGEGYTLGKGARLVLRNGRRAGSFSGVAAGRRVTGTFRC
jgi:hypothetical protein